RPVHADGRDAEAPRLVTQPLDLRERGVGLQEGVVDGPGEFGALHHSFPSGRPRSARCILRPTLRLASMTSIFSGVPFSRGSAAARSTSGMAAVSRRQNRRDAFAVSSITSWCERRCFERPAARFAMQEIPAARTPIWFATVTSGTVDMPTASAPIRPSIRISAGVSYDGPLTAAYTPSRRRTRV